MDIKSQIISELQEAKLNLTEAIGMMENNADCIQIHKLINKAIHALEASKKKMLNEHLDECLTKFYKNNAQGKKVRQEITNFFHT